MEQRLLLVWQLAVLLQPQFQYAVTVAPIMGPLLVLVEVVRDVILTVVTRRFGCGLVFKSKDGYVDALAQGVLFLGEDLLLVSRVVCLLYQVLDDIRITILGCNMQCRVVAVGASVQIDARFLDYYLNTLEVATSAQVVEDVPALEI